VFYSSFSSGKRGTKGSKLMTKKVLHVFGIMNRGGAELRTLSTLKDMRAKGVEYEFVVLSGQQGVLDQQIIDAGSKVHYCALGFTFLFRFCRLLHGGKYDVVHSHVSLVSGVMLFLAWVFSVKVRIAHFRSTHDVANPGFARRLRDKFLRTLILTFATHVAGVCKAAIDAFWHFDWHNDRRFHVIYNGFIQNKVETEDSFWPQHLKSYTPEKIILNVSRMHEQKNHPRLVKIFCHYCERFDDAVLVLIGKEDAKIKAKLLTLSEGTNAAGRIYYLGEQSHVLPFMAHADVMLFPSKWEGLPGAVLESASLGTPVLASDIPGVLEIAEQLHIVQHLSLEQTDNIWIDKLVSIMTNRCSRDAAQQEFKSSVFQLEYNVKQLYALYS
jgi:glycosyltransferase involved in cell wall biosynthesis